MYSSYIGQFSITSTVEITATGPAHALHGGLSQQVGGGGGSGCTQHGVGGCSQHCNWQCLHGGRSQLHGRSQGVQGISGMLHGSQGFSTYTSQSQTEQSEHSDTRNENKVHRHGKYIWYSNKDWYSRKKSWTRHTWNGSNRWSDNVLWNFDMNIVNGICFDNHLILVVIVRWLSMWF